MAAITCSERPATAARASPGRFRRAAPPGRYAVFAQWSSGPNRASNATYQVTSAAGAANVPVNQKRQRRQLAVARHLRLCARPKGRASTLTDKADGVVVADAIRFVGPQAGATRLPAALAPPNAAAHGHANSDARRSNRPAPRHRARQPVTTTNDARYFTQTGYRISEDAFWNYFQVRGGAAHASAIPSPTPSTCTGTKVQIFQRQILQLRPDGGVQTMNILDDGLLPYTRMNGSTFPAADPSVIVAVA